MTHQLKIYPQYYERVLSKEKLFEIRFNDRDFQKGDDVVLREFDPLKKLFDMASGLSEEEQLYTGRQMRAVITYVTYFEQKPGWVVFGFRPYEVADNEVEVDLEKEMLYQDFKQRLIAEGVCLQPI